jgi:hypothetical protein
MSRVGAVILRLALVPQIAFSQKKAAPVKSLRLYVFDGGVIRGFDPALFQFKQPLLMAKASSLEPLGKRTTMCSATVP